MGPATAVLACALDLLGAPARELPPIELVAAAPPDVSPNANGFVRADSSVIYLITSAEPFRRASCHYPKSLVPLAGIVMHEAWHVRHGSDERGAYEAQLMTLLRLGARPDSPMYRSVQRAMRSVLADAKPRARARAPAESPAPQAPTTSVARRTPSP